MVKEQAMTFKVRDCPEKSTDGVLAGLVYGGHSACNFCSGTGECFFCENCLRYVRSELDEEDVLVHAPHNCDSYVAATPGHNARVKIGFKLGDRR
jgi:hypothetical protein